ncbi:TonB-dependent receptor [Aquimarina brevivitae]|uniref:Iron complex outermembrane receptor protein n=1 Tax=Aquimarina brevivitae TaxID=323412 RepID=A0A4Q7NUJ2_9FLAO|nr:TonB-dependent receptor [Aquimarina brevivitae]RZS90600.1 iron complex outermembrane receptor protein [Aquimarina brevivitae]
MKINIVSFWLIISCITLANAQQNQLKIKVVAETTQSPLPGASVVIENTNQGGMTTMDGWVTFDQLATKEYTFVISFLGYQTVEKIIQVKGNQEVVISLKQDTDALETIVIQTNRSTRTIKKIPTRIEFIGGEELMEKNMMNSTNISMVLRESTGIQMQQTSLSSGNSNIRIQGLDGRYTQLLRDGFPLYGGFSSGLSIMQIPPLDIKQFEIIKGSSSTLYGGGAIAGLVNLVSKTPEEDPELDLMFTQTQALGSTANVFYSERNNKFGWTLYGSGNYQKAYDPDDDNFSNLPETTSVSFNPKLFYYPSEKTTFWIGLNGTYDQRTGGDMTAIADSSADLYTEKNTSKRVSSQLAFTTKIDSLKSVTIKNSVSYFDRALELPDLNFIGTQWNSFSEVNYNSNGRNTDWVLGANVYTTSFNEESTSIERDQQDITYGAFVNSIADLSEQWILEAGLRTDYAEDWGLFALPRLSLLFKNDKGFSSRIGGGLGYKIPTLFTEAAESIFYRNVLPIDKNILEAEQSFGGNLDFNYQTMLFETIGLSFNQLFYVTAIKNALLLNSVGDDQLQFENAIDNIVSKGAETNIKFSYKDFRWFLNYALIDTRLTYLPGNPQKPLTARHNAGSVVMYESEKWRFGFETYYIGEQVLSNGNETTDYVLMGLLGVRNFDWGSIYMNFENFTDRRQTRFTPLVLPPRDNPTFTEIYAPAEGFILSLGIIIKPFGNEGHH